MQLYDLIEQAVWHPTISVNNCLLGTPPWSQRWWLTPVKCVTTSGALPLADVKWPTIKWMLFIQKHIYQGFQCWCHASWLDIWKSRHCRNAAKKNFVFSLRSAAIPRYVAIWRNIKFVHLHMIYELLLHFDAENGKFLISAHFLPFYTVTFLLDRLEAWPVG